MPRNGFFLSMAYRGEAGGESRGQGFQDPRTLGWRIPGGIGGDLVLDIGIYIQTLPFNSCLSFGKLPPLSEPQGSNL